MTDEQAVADEVQSVLDVAVTAAVYEFDRIPGANGRPGTLPVRYLAFAVSPVYNPVVKADGTTTEVSGYRIYVSSDADNIANARLAIREAKDALERQRLTVGGKVSTPLRFESGSAPEPNTPLRYRGDRTWTCAF